MRESPLRPAPGKRVAMPVGDSNNQGNFILKKGAGDIWKPAFDGTATTIRIFPGLNPDNPTEFDPWRFNSSEDGLGQWFYPVTCAMSIGHPQKSWVLYDPTDTAYDPQTNPVWMLVSALERAIRDRKDRGGWAGMMKGSPGKGAMLSRPKDCVLVQCAIMCYKNKIYAPPKGGGAPGTDSTVFFLLTPSARKAMMEQMNMRIENYRGDPDNIASHFVHGDPISLHAGQYVTFFKLGSDPREQMRRPAQRQSTFGQNAGRAQQESSEDQAGYGCFLSPEFDGLPAQLSGAEHVVRGHVKSFWESINIPPIETQVRWLEDSFRGDADALVYALDDAYGGMLSPAYRDKGLDILGRGRPVQGGYDQYRDQAGMQPHNPWGMPVGLPPGQPQATPPALGGWGGAAPEPVQEYTEQTTDQQGHAVFGGYAQSSLGYPPPAQQGYAPPAAGSAPQPDYGRPVQANVQPNYGPPVQPPAGPPPAQGGWGARPQPTTHQAPQQQAPQQQAPPPQAAPQQQAPPPQAAPQYAPPPQAAPQYAPPPQAAPQYAQPPQAQYAPPPQVQYAPPPQQQAPPVASQGGWGGQPQAAQAPVYTPNVATPDVPRGIPDGAPQGAGAPAAPSAVQAALERARTKQQSRRVTGPADGQQGPPPTA